MRTMLIIHALLLLACSKPDADPSPASTSSAAMPPGAAAPAAMPAAASKKVTAKEVADKLVAEGVLANCKEVVPNGLSARASERWDCDLPSVPGKGAAVLGFEADDGYAATVKAYDEAAVLVGAHRYGNAKARVFVQLNSGAPLDVGKKAKALVAAF